MKHFLIAALIIPTLCLAQHTITGTFNPPEQFNVALLYKSTPTNLDYVGYSRINDDGSISITLDANQPSGIYRLVYALPQDQYNFEIIYNGEEDVAFEFDVEKGLTFTSSEDNKLLLTYKSELDNFNQTIGTLYNAETINETAITEAFQQLNSFQDKFEKSSEGLIANQFIKAYRQYTPNSFEPAKVYANQLKTEYFKYLDFTKPNLLSSKMIKNKLLAYIFSFGRPENDNKLYKTAIQTVIDQIADYKAYQVEILETVWDYALQDNESLASYIANTYLINLAKETNNEVLLNKMQGFLNVAIGNKAVNFDINSTNLYALEGFTNYVLIFWSSSCPHCLDQLPHVKAYFNTYSKTNKVKVIAIGLENEPGPWEEEIKSYPNFLHVYASGKWGSKIAADYNITATPTYIILNSDKQIVSKPDTLNELKQFFSDKQ